jgi:dethiobiotin synthetase
MTTRSPSVTSSARRRAFFVTGTDTHAGKTFVSCALLTAARQRGLSALGLKPLAAGADTLTTAGPRNGDALALQAASSQPLAYETINPVLLQAACAPHIAAQLEKRQLSLSRLEGFCRAGLSERADFTLIEGAGGWQVPINAHESLADLATALKLPVILVVAMRLGCLNHALLTAESIARSGLTLAGWVANDVGDAMPYRSLNIDTLNARLGAPCLGDLSHCTPALAAEHLAPGLNRWLLAPNPERLA